MCKLKIMKNHLFFIPRIIKLKIQLFYRLRGVNFKFSTILISTEFAHYYWFVLTWNLWNFKRNLWFISWDIQILNKRTYKSKKISCAFDFLGLGYKLGQIFTSISSKNWLTRFSKCDLQIFFSYQNIKEFFFSIFITYILMPFLYRIEIRKSRRPIFR